MIERFIATDGSVLEHKVRAAQDLCDLVMPSERRALDLAKAYRVLVGKQRWDLGRDVAIAKFIEEADKFNANIIGTSALLTTTMTVQKELEEELKKASLKDRFKTMVGGAPVTQRWAKRIGADAFAEDAIEAVNKAKLLLG